MTEARTSEQQAEFLDGTLKYGSIEGKRCGDPSVIAIFDRGEGHELLCTVAEARALKLWLELVLPPVEVQQAAPKVEA